eukprot:CAMPEP_0114673592 /NCGR_PEP_ID=MMETSP0191-20121206/44919_1 /TAXON_ID=126664 /ORGANISM="Sorites sp." /LENGTH=228 /DNA_ID=CAMNT_0001938803 /DNA_START=1284 /DNA_END=1970 /DNA_ORIENTATION=-
MLQYLTSGAEINHVFDPIIDLNNNNPANDTEINNNNSNDNDNEGNNDENNSSNNNDNINIITNNNANDGETDTEAKNDDNINENINDNNNNTTIIALKKEEINKPLVGSGKSVLHEAAYYNAFDVAEFLLQNGAQQNIEDEEGQIPRDLAELTGAKEALKLLDFHDPNFTSHKSVGLTLKKRGSTGSSNGLTIDALTPTKSISALNDADSDDTTPNNSFQNNHDSYIK